VARRTPFVRTFRSKRNTDWGFGVDMLAQSLTISGKLLGTTSLSVVEQQTIVRIRGLIHLQLTSVDVVSAGFLGACGIGLVQNDAFSVGITALPGPQTDANWDGWMWHSFFDVRAVTATIADGANAVGVDQRLEIDSKAMRKWTADMTLILMVEVTESGTATLRVNGDSRILLKAA